MRQWKKKSLLPPIIVLPLKPGKNVILAVHIQAVLLMTAETEHKTNMVMQDVNYELFAESVEAECSFGICRPDQEVIRQTMEHLPELKELFAVSPEKEAEISGCLLSSH